MLDESSSPTPLVPQDTNLLQEQIGASSGPAGPNAIQQFLAMSKHPWALVFHFAFKTLAIIFYLFGGAFSDFVFVFVLIIILQAVDFWTVKNVSGRLMVGLRWWNQINEDGSTEWRFESLEDRSKIPTVDYRCFWGGLFAPVLFWVPATFSAFFGFNFHWFLCDLISCALCTANIMGYMKASRTATQQITAFGTSVATNLVTRAMLGGAAGAGAQPTPNPNAQV